MGQENADLFKGSGTIDQHPLPERIVAYHERRLPPDEAEEIRAHLAVCPDCTTELLALADLYDGVDDPAAEVSPAGMETAWQRQRERLFPAEASSVVVPLESRREVRPPRRDWRTAVPFALAASLLAVVALVQWRTIVRLEAPRANPPLVNLEPLDSTRSGAGAAPALNLPADSERLWVILNPSDPREDSLYEVHLAAPDGKVVLRFEDLEVSEEGNFRLEIPRSVLAPGDSTLYLYETAGARRWLVEKFLLSVAASP